MKTLKERYNIVVADYLEAFIKKHGFENDFDWVDEVSGICNISDYFLNFSDIKIDIDHELDPEIILAWYDYSLEQHFKNEPCPNLINYSKGARYEDKEV